MVVCRIAISMKADGVAHASGCCHTASGRETAPGGRWYAPVGAGWAVVCSGGRHAGEGVRANSDERRGTGGAVFFARSKIAPRKKLQMDGKQHRPTGNGVVEVLGVRGSTGTAVWDFSARPLASPRRRTF